MVELELTNGCKIRSGGEQFMAGAFVQVVNSNDCEIGYWSANEWEEEPEQVMGAILRCAELGLSADQLLQGKK